MSTRTGALEIPRGHRPRAWLAIGAVFVAATVAIGVLATFQGSDGPATSINDASGYARMEEFVNSGFVPREALQPMRPEPVYSAQDRALMAAVANGVVPEEALDTEDFLIKRLINQGLIPRQTIDS